MGEFEPTVTSRPLRSATESERKMLHEIYAKELVDELQTRSGVNTIEIPPYAKVSVTVEGSAVLLNVID